MPTPTSVAALCALVLQAAAAATVQPAARPAPSRASIVLTPPLVERRDPELARLRDGLLTAIRERRAAAVRALMAPTIVDQDTPTPADAVLAALGPLARGAPLADEWRALEQALRLGGAVRDGRYVVPYIEPHVAGWQARREHRFVAGRDVAVRAEPDPAAPVLARLSHVLIADDPRRSERRGEPGSACPSWTVIAIDAGGTGWICTVHTRHVSGLYYAFEKVEGAWRLSRVYSILQ